MGKSFQPCYLDVRWCTHVCLAVLLRHCKQLCQVTQFFQELLCIIVGAQVVSIPRHGKSPPSPTRNFGPQGTKAQGNQGPDSSSTKLRLRNEKSSGSSDILRKTCREVATIEAVNRWTNKYLVDEPKKHPRWAKCLTLLDFDFAIRDIRAVIPTESGLRIWTTLFVSKAHVQVSARLQCPRRSFYQVPPGVIKRSNRKPPHILCRFIAGKFGGVSIDTFDHWRVYNFYNMHHEQCQCFHSEGSGINTWPTVSPVRSVALFQS